MRNGSPIVILSCPYMAEMAAAVCANLNRGSRRPKYSQMTLVTKRFRNGEVLPRIPETIRGKRVYLMLSLFYPDVNTALINLVVTCNAVRLASASDITLVIPFIPYLRQDRKDEPRVPISAKAIAKLCELNPIVNRIITFDMHAEQEEGFFENPVDPLYGRVLFAEHFRKLFRKDFSNTLVVAPDFGGSVRANRFAQLLGTDIPVGILKKNRKAGSKVEHQMYIGDDPTDKRVIIFDDMIDTANTTVGSIKAMQEKRAKQVYVCATHPIFSLDDDSTAEEKLANSGAQVVVTDSIERDMEYRDRHKKWLTVLPIHRLLKEAIYQSECPGGSVSKLARI